jgi:hypothetical protein
MENAQGHRRNGTPGHCLVGLATSDKWGCFHPILFAAQAQPRAERTRRGQAQPGDRIPDKSYETAVSARGR